MYSIAYFSPTGNTKFLSNELKNSLYPNNTQLIDIVHTNGCTIEKNDHLIIMFSIHAFNAPPEVINFAKSILKSRFNTISIIAVGCNTTWINEAASLSLRKILISKGYKITLDRILAMPLTFVAKLPNNTCLKLVSDAQLEIKSISNDLKSNTTDNKVVSSKAKLLAYIGKIEKYAAKLFGLELHANKNCISCGLCWSSCPSQNIKEKNNKPKFGLNCSMCMRCIYKCPVNAINPYISRFIPLNNGYSVNNYTKQNITQGDTNNENS